MLEIITRSLLVVPCSLDIAKSLVLHRNILEKKSPILIPHEWPSWQVQSLLPLYIERLEADKSEYGWGIWIMILRSKKTICGDIVIEGKPDQDGVIKITHNLVDDIVDLSLAYEAIDAIIEWMMITHDVKKIYTECNVSNQTAIKVFEKLGMRCINKEGRFLVWETCDMMY
ncbi:N-acetyltransferase [Bacillus sp. HMF5848]|uniref:GNAT family N-acetyltransferase n=1 Tax=Bacillus sp. HMF5848 TaxID=2495421 RepID=UPI000F7AFAA3|nr:GNAT family protein [Bacillus sp. HMF5848]RSK26904.1 N-acetyltransferase [Bacillus sp. HMF5848]